MNQNFKPCLAIAAVALIMSVIGGVPRADAASASHCVMTVIGQRASGELVTAAPRCYATSSQALRAAGVDTAGGSITRPDQLQSSGRLGVGVSSVIGIHYDGANQTGSSMIVNGSACNGGWLNVAAAWNDRISSTWQACPRVAHFRDANLLGPSQSTFGSGGNLTTLDNLTTSIQYLT